MNWKVYVHYEDEHLEHTALVQLPPTASVSDIVKEFTASIQKAFPKADVDVTKYQLTKSNGRVLDPSQTLAKASIIPKEDLFVISKSSSVHRKPVPSEDDKKNADNLKQKGNAEMAKKSYKKAIQYYSDAIKLLPENAILFSNRSQANLNLKNYQAALDDSNKAIKLDSTFAKAYLRAGKAAMGVGDANSAKSFFVRGLRVTDSKNDKLSKTMSKEFRKLIDECQMAIENQSTAQEREKAVVAEFQKSIEQIKDLFSRGKLKETAQQCEQILKLIPGEKVSTHYLSTILLSADKYKKAIEVLEPAVDAHPDELELRISLAEAYYHTGDHMKAVKILTGIEKLVADDKDNERVSIRVARHLLKIGQEDTATKLIMGVLKKNENNPEALMEYGNLLLEKGVLHEAIKVLLRALILNSEDKTVRRKLAIAVRAPEGLKFLLEDLQDANSASARGFLALIFKDFGALEQSEQLFKSAAELAPSSATYWLNYIHVLEIIVKYQEAFDSTVQYLENNSKLSLPPVKPEDKEVSCADILSEIKELKDISLALKQRSGGEGKKAEDVFGSCDEKLEHNFTAEQLDLLALLFTLVKILYVTGNIESIVKIVPLIERARRGKQLHLTSIRNEHAYYCCIGQLLPYISTPLPDYEPLYVVGDSHTLPTAWQTITVDGTKRLLIPKLVTGCKMWHLRKEAYFFPKENFDNMISSIPDGSEAVFLFGEIDCREGILVAVEKCRYENVQHGIDHTIDIYMDKLKEVKKQKNIRMYIHPVVPVLNETRDMVKQFNVTLEEKVKQMEGIVWLDFFSSLLTEDGNSLVSDYTLDGTHMNPTYISLLESSINATK